MRLSSMLVLAVAFFAFSFVVSSCVNKAKESEAETEQVKSDSTAQESTSDKQGKEYTSAYVCPMHCEGSGSDKPGKCPVCEMDYVANHDHDDHTHEM